jgi:hypothetical protein
MRTDGQTDRYDRANYILFGDYFVDPAKVEILPLKKEVLEEIILIEYIPLGLL